MYFYELMHTATNTQLEIIVDTMHQYVVVSTTLNNMIHMLSNELDKGAKLVYQDATEKRVHF